MATRRGYKIALKDGCPGCGHPWGTKEGQCSRCKRCLSCCDKERVPYSCGWKFARKSLAQQVMSAAAYERWINNPRMLSKNRRIV
jgi:hypothetical protein